MVFTLLVSRWDCSQVAGKRGIPTFANFQSIRPGAPVHGAWSEYAINFCYPPDIHSMFSAHKVGEFGLDHMEVIRKFAAGLAVTIQDRVPAGPNQTLALRHLEDCVMRANKGIAEQYPIQEAAR